MDGVECEVGKVLVWDPPARLVLGWQLTPDWKFDPDLITVVEVRFIPEGGGATRVELEHRIIGINDWYFFPKVAAEIVGQGRHSSE
jgi:uncharacterized protein YndB with AHSA1/START domain